MKDIDLSVAITFHTEGGEIAKKTLESTQKALDDCDFTYEIIAHIDNGDFETTNTIKSLAKTHNIIVMCNSFGDLPSSRNYCAQHANGRNICFLDGDDIMSDNWFKEALDLLSKKPEAIIHPEYNVTFGVKEKNIIWKMHDSFSEEKDKLILVGHNRWCATCMLATDIAKSHPYKPFKPGFGYEDWFFNAETRADGIEHLVAKDTILFYRIKEDGSVYKLSQNEHRALPKSAFFNIDGAPQNYNLAFTLYNARVKNKFAYLAKKTKAGRAINNNIGKNKISAKAKEIISQSELIKTPIQFLDSYNSEQPLLGRFYYKLLLDIKKKGFDAKNFNHVTSRLTNDEKDLLLTQLVVQNNLKDIVLPKEEFYDNWLENHKVLLNSLKTDIKHTSVNKKTVFLIRGIWPEAYGGAESYQVYLGTELKKNGYNPIVVTSSIKLLKEAKKAGLETIKAPYNKQQNWSGYRNLFLPAFMIWENHLTRWYTKKIKEYNPDILHVQSRDEFIAATLAGKKMNKKVIWTDHSDLRLVAWENINIKYKNPIGKYIFKLANIPAKITTISEYEYNFVNKIIPRKLSNFVVVPNGSFDHMKDYPRKDCHNVVGFVGRIVDYKGVEELIRAFDIVSKKHKDAQLLIYGTGENVDYYKNLSENKNIIFKGYTNEPYKAYSEMGIFVLPSYHEGLSLALLDAAMIQKALIATDIDGNPEIVKDKETGLLVKPRDVDSLAEALDKLLSSPTLQKKYAQNARKLYEEKYDFPTIVKEQIIPIYEEKGKEKK